MGVPAYPAHRHAPPSEHDPLRIVEALAELIGQNQHLIELQEALIGRNIYDPIVIDLSVSQSQQVNLPAEAHQIETVQVSSDTAVTIKVFRQGPHDGANGTLIGQVYVPAASAAPPLVINCAVPPSSCTLLITTSVAVGHGACVVTLARTRPGGYPYAG